MDREYLITFKSTTAALKAKRLIDQGGEIKDAEVVPVPFALSETCFGMGIRLHGNEDSLADIRFAMEKLDIDFKRFWLIGKEYSLVEPKARKVG